MMKLSREILWDCQINTKLFPDGDDTHFCVVIDEAPKAAASLTNMFCSTWGKRFRPGLHPLYRFFNDSELVYGIILVRTELTIKTVLENKLGHSAKQTQADPIIFTDTMYFSGESSGIVQEDYVRRYLKLSDEESDLRLLERIKFWFSRRHVSFHLFVYAASEE
jgi:hypothetical protein